MRGKLKFTGKKPIDCSQASLQFCNVIDLTGQSLQDIQQHVLPTVSSQKNIKCDNLWSCEFVPTEECQLVIAKDRISSIKEWLEYQKSMVAKSQDSNGGTICRLLFLQGPTGSGKSSSVRVLGREVGFNIKEWSDKMQDGYADSQFLNDGQVRRQTNLDRFENFIGTSTRKLRFSQNTDAQPRLIFISEIPFAWHRESQQRLINILTQRILESNHPIIIKITEYYSDNNELGHNFQSRNIPKLIEEQLTMHGYPQPRTIALNQITEAGIKKVFQRIIDAKGLQNNFTKEDINEIVRCSDRDLRYAINSLQMYVNEETVLQKSNCKRKRGKEKNSQLQKKRRQTKKLMQSGSQFEFQTQENSLGVQQEFKFLNGNNSQHMQQDFISTQMLNQQNNQFLNQNIQQQIQNNITYQFQNGSQFQTQHQPMLSQQDFQQVVQGQYGINLQIQNGNQNQDFAQQNLMFQNESQQNQQIEENPISKLIKPHDKGSNLMLGLGKIVYQKEDAWTDLDGLLSKMDTTTETLVAWLEEKMFERFGISDEDDEFRWEKFDESVQILNYLVDAVKISSGAFNSRGSQDSFADENSKQVVVCDRIGSIVGALGFMCGLKHEGKRGFQPNRRPKFLDIEKHSKDAKQQIQEFRKMHSQMRGELLSNDEVITCFDLQQMEQLLYQQQSSEVDDIEDII